MNADNIEPNADAEEATLEPKPEEQPKPKKADTPKVVAPYAVVGGGETDEVLLSRCVYKNRVTRKSLTVHHLQRRLVELGFADAGTDKDGWYADHTLRAVKAFQEKNGLPATGVVDADMFRAVFKGDPNVTVVIDV
jgi:peptidoglycan hydrolase-like protein with peptidoglycan-binding domain